MENSKDERIAKWTGNDSLKWELRNGKSTILGGYLVRKLSP